MSTNPYTEIYRASRARQAQPAVRPRGVSALEQMMIDDRDNQRRLEIMTAPPPDQVARQSRVARDAGVEPAMVGDIDAAERAGNAKRVTQVFGRYPALGRWAAASPRGAITAQDDHDTLRQIGDAFDVLKARGSQAIDLTGAFGWGHIDQVNEIGAYIQTPLDAVFATAIDSPIGRVLGIPRYDPAAARAQQRARSQARYRSTTASIETNDRRAQTGNYWIDQTTAGLTSLIPTLAATGLAVVTRNPGAASTLPALGVAGDAYQKAREQGLGVGQSSVYSFTQGATEKLTEVLPAGALVDALVKRTTFGKTIVRQLATEIPGEQIATALQDFTDWATLPENSDRTFGDYVAARPAAALATALQTTGGTVAQTTIATATDRTLRAAGKLTERVGQARTAKAQATQLDRMEKAATSSKLRGRDPVAFGEMVAAQAEEYDLAHICLHGQALRIFMGGSKI